MTPDQTLWLATQTQFCLVLIFGLAGFALKRGRPFKHGNLPYVCAASAAILALIALLFCRMPGQQPDTLWGPSSRMIPPLYAAYTILLLDLAGITYLVFRTGGSESSCFSPLYFMLPTFALLLFGESSFVFAFCAAAAIAFALTLFTDYENRRFFNEAGSFAAPKKPSLIRASKRAYLLVSILCFGLAIYIDVGKADTERKNRHELENALSRYQLRLSYDDLEAEFRKLGGRVDEQNNFLKGCVGKTVRWKVKLFKATESGENMFVTFGGKRKTSYSEQPVRFALVPRAWWEHVRDLEPGDEFILEGILLESTEALHLRALSVAKTDTE